MFGCRAGMQRRRIPMRVGFRFTGATAGGDMSGCPATGGKSDAVSIRNAPIELQAGVFRRTFEWRRMSTPQQGRPSL